MATAKHYKPLYAQIASGEYDSQKIFSDDRVLNVKYSTYLTDRKAQIFVLSDELGLAAQKLAKTKSNVVPEDLKEIRLPYPETVIEMNLTPEVKALRDNKDPHATNTICKVGVHLKAQPEGAIIAQPYWQYEDNHVVEVTMLSVVFNAPESVCDKLTKAMIVLPNGRMISVHMMLSSVWANGADPLIAHALNYQFRKDPELFKRAATETVEELSTLMFAALSLINCKSGVTKTEVPAKKAPPNYEGQASKKRSCPKYTVLSLSEIESVSEISGFVSKRSDLAAHYVRGHFKVRQSGVYWWGPFVRGSGPLRKREAYKVVS